MTGKEMARESRRRTDKARDMWWGYPSGRVVEGIPETEVCCSGSSRIYGVWS